MQGLQLGREGGSSPWLITEIIISGSPLTDESSWDFPGQRWSKSGSESLGRELPAEVLMKFGCLKGLILNLLGN